MKKIMLSLLILFCIIMCSCNFDNYYGMRPSDLGNAKWVCEEPSAYFIVDSSSEYPLEHDGELTWNDTTYYLELSFVGGTNIVLGKLQCRDPSNNVLRFEFDWKCDFLPDKLIIDISDDNDAVFNGNCDELVFYKTTN